MSLHTPLTLAPQARRRPQSQSKARQGPLQRDQGWQQGPGAGAAGSRLQQAMPRARQDVPDMEQSGQGVTAWLTREWGQVGCGQVTAGGARAGRGLGPERQGHEVCRAAGLF